MLAYRWPSLFTSNMKACAYDRHVRACLYACDSLMKLLALLSARSKTSSLNTRACSVQSSNYIAPLNGTADGLSMSTRARHQREQSIPCKQLELGGTSMRVRDFFLYLYLGPPSACTTTCEFIQPVLFRTFSCS